MSKVNKVEVSFKSLTASCLTTSFARSAQILVSLPHLSALPRLNGEKIWPEKSPRLLLSISLLHRNRVSDLAQDPLRIRMCEYLRQLIS